MATWSNVYSPFAKTCKSVIKAFGQYGIKVTLTSGYRSSVAQADLRRENQGFPVAAPGRSQHQYGLAADLVANPYSYQSALGQVMQRLGIYWAGTSDPVHFSVLTPSQWAQVLGLAEAVPSTPFTQPTVSTPTATLPKISALEVSQAPISIGQSGGYSAPLIAASSPVTLQTPTGQPYIMQPITIPEGQSPDYYSVETWQRLLAQGLITNPEVAQAKLQKLLSS